MVATDGFDKKHMTCRMQTPAYRAKFIDPLPEGVRLPIPIEEYAPGGQYHPDTPHAAADESEAVEKLDELDGVRLLSAWRGGT